MLYAGFTYSDIFDFFLVRWGVVLTSYLKNKQQKNATSLICVCKWKFIQILQIRKLAMLYICYICELFASWKWHQNQNIHRKIVSGIDELWKRNNPEYLPGISYHFEFLRYFIMFTYYRIAQMFSIKKICFMHQSHSDVRIVQNIAAGIRCWRDVFEFLSCSLHQRIPVRGEWIHIIP